MDGKRGFGLNAAALADSVYRRCAATLREPPSVIASTHITELETLFEQSPTQQLAYHTILAQVQRHPLVWHRGSASPARDLPVPPWWDPFVADVVRQLLITGVAFYKIMVRRGLDMGVVSPIGLVHPRWNSRRSAFEPDKSGWKMLVLESPLRLTNNRIMLRSGATRAEKATQRLLDLQENWHNRDRMNSKPAVFTTISSELANQNGSQRQWFKNVTNPDVLQTRAVDVDSSFSTLVHKRAETIRELDAITSIRRGERAGAGRGFPTPGTRASIANDSNDDEGDHYEHIVSDGRAYTEARPLHSLPDTKIMMDELAHSIFFAFGVPPQALGKNINSERLASSNRLTEMAITAFDLMVQRIRTIVGKAISDATEQDDGMRLDFAPILTSHELNELMPMLKTKTAIEMLSRHSGLPPSAFDPERVRGVQCGNKPGEAGAATQKRPRTEEETVAVLRKRAREPATT